jgi:hypothetical protein
MRQAKSVGAVKEEMAGKLKRFANKPADFPM